MIVDLNVTSVLICILAYILAVGPAHFLVCKILKKYSLTEKGGLEGAGAMIGFLERIFTLTFVLIGQYTALVLILTAKSIARFEELKDRKFAEYYLIGTLSSMLFAMLIGIFALWLLKIL